MESARQFVKKLLLENRPSGSSKTQGNNSRDKKLRIGKNANLLAKILISILNYTVAKSARTGNVWKTNI